MHRRLVPKAALSGVRACFMACKAHEAATKRFGYSLYVERCWAFVCQSEVSAEEGDEARGEEWQATHERHEGFEWAMCCGTPWGCEIPGKAKHGPKAAAEATGLTICLRDGGRTPGSHCSCWQVSSHGGLSHHQARASHRHRPESWNPSLELAGAALQCEYATFLCP